MSLRARVLVGSGLIAVVLGVVAVLIPRITASYLVDQVDDRLQATEIRGHPPEGGGRDPGDGPERPSQTYVALVAGDGSVSTLFTPNVGEDALPSVDGEEALDHARTGEPYTVDSDQAGVRYRLLAREGEDGGAVVVGIPLEDADDTVARLVAIEVAAVAVALAVLALVAWWVIRLGVRPVKEMAATATEIGAGDLSARVPEYAPETEAGQLGLALNQMLGRIEDEFDQRVRSEQRLRQFAADASHELRTPVTTIRGYAELYRSAGLADPDELAEALRRVEQESVRMGELVDDLLRLARLDQGQPLERAPVDLVEIAHDVVRDAEAIDPGRPYTVDAPTEVVVAGDERLLRQVVANLVTNARVHTGPSTPVHVRVGGDGDRAVLEVADEGPGLRADEAERVFERFYRADPARSRHRGGSGLGLAIVAATVEAHGGEVGVTSREGEGATFRVTLPVA